MESLQRNLNALMALTFCGILLGAFAFQFVEHEQPCPLCMLQRLAMLAVATSALMNVRFGPQPAHYGLGIIGALFGAFVSLRQISLHVCAGFPTFGTPVWGLSLYTWAFIAFTCSLFANGVLLVMYKNGTRLVRPANWLGQIAIWLVLGIAIANIVTTLLQCGLGPCEG